MVLTLAASLQELKAYQIRHAKTQIKKRAIGQLAFDLHNGLPDEVSTVPYRRLPGLNGRLSTA